MRCSRLVPLIILFCGVSFSVSAKTPGLAPSLTAKREMPYGTEQISVVFRGTKAELAINSNFLQARGGGKVKLGHFKASMTPDLKLMLEELELLRDLLDGQQAIDDMVMPPRGNLEIPTRSPHAVRAFVDDREARQDGGAYKRVLSLLSGIENSGEWKPLDAVAISAEGQKLKLEPGGLKSRSELGCVGSPGEDIRCAVKDFGIFYIWAPSIED